ncbi:unnamed protein product [Owenia fusiformis]|uniref:Purple acid phosphatase n=1 Tax=Owenia fusiformis TaxID=6347 RepID=A0A8J1T754_OWEFU|nr:unnamed protein product [Owenia fusiformis]
MSRIMFGIMLALAVVTNTMLVKGEVYYQPQQIHLSYSTEADGMQVTWVTFNATMESIVQYETENGGGMMEASGGTTVFKDGGPEGRLLYIHTVTLRSLKPGTKYMYHCGSDLGWSAIYWFRTSPAGSDWPARFAVYGDMGNKNAVSMGRLQEETQLEHFDAILHVGDFAYDMDSDNARVGDEFMQQIETIAAYVPYMTCVGNHEEKYNFSNYKQRFKMPGGDGENLWYSFNVGLAHIVAISTEVYFYTNYGTKQIQEQYKWLQRDLEVAASAENRKIRPWIIVFGHKPMYCSNPDNTLCGDYKDNIIRNGLNGESFEKLFYKYGVDLQFYAHEHSYERLFPVYNTKVCNGSKHDPYLNPGAPVHIITGSAGCQEGQTEFRPNVFPWSAFHTRDYGYTRMEVTNHTHLHIEQVSDDKGGKVIDAITIVKEQHGLESFNCH